MPRFRFGQYVSSFCHAFGHSRFITKNAVVRGPVAGILEIAMSLFRSGYSIHWQLCCVL